MKTSLGPFGVYTGTPVEGFVYGVGDRSLTPREGVRELAEHLGRPLPAFVNQVHGDAIVTPGEAATDGSSEADAILLGPGEGGTIRIADCVPVILLNRATGRGAVIHAGWRGTFARIVTKTVERLGDPGDIQAYIGPAIGGCCYRVSDELAQDFAARFARGDWLMERADGPYLDLQALNAEMLGAMGVAAIEVEPRCTRESSDLHSFRRDGAEAGRLVAFLFVG